MATALASEPALGSWLHSGLWRRGFDRGSQSRGEWLAETSRIDFTEIRHVAGEQLECEALIDGSAGRRYRTRVRFVRVAATWRVEAECACPVGLYCKHGVALILRLSQYPETGAPPAAPPAVPAGQVMEPAVRDWLARLEKANRTPPDNRPRSGQAQDQRFLAYCLKPAPTRAADGWSFNLHVAQRRRDGTFSISSTVAQADPARPPRYMTREDFVPTALYHQRFRRLGLWAGMPVEGADWDELFTATQATGRLFALRPRDGEWQVVHFGPPVHVEAAWEIAPDGSARPVLRGGLDGRVFLPTLPPRYLDPETGELGTVTSDLAPALLAAWALGPRIPAGSLPEVTTTLSQAVPAAPPPVVMETVRLSPAPPSPRLEIGRTALENFGEILHGTLHFRYPIGPPLAYRGDEAPAAHHWQTDNKRWVLPRDPAAERAAFEQLRSAGFAQLADVFPEIDVPPALKWAVVPAEPVPTLHDAWLNALESPAVHRLRRSGWSVETLGSAALTVRNAGALFTGIEADAEIDWFRFDGRFECDGHELSLIPVIAAAIRQNTPPADSPDLPEFVTVPAEEPLQGFIRFPARRLMEIVDQVRFLFRGRPPRPGAPLRLDRLAAADLADTLALDSTETARSLARLGRSLKEISELDPVDPPPSVRADLRPYQLDGFRWLRFLATHGLHGILADDMGLGKTLQTLAHLAATHSEDSGMPSLVIAPTSVVSNWAAEAEKFTPALRRLVLHGKDRAAEFRKIPEVDLVITSYPLLVRDFNILKAQEWRVLVLDEAQHIKNPKAGAAISACALRAENRLCLSGTPMENHLGELWSLLRFLMPGFLGDEKPFNLHLRRPIEREHSTDAQRTLNRRVAPLILRRTKDEVATDLPPKTELVHHIELNSGQTNLYESVRAAMDKRVREAIADRGLAQSQILVLDALLKLRQICCDPRLLQTTGNSKPVDSAKLEYLTAELLPTLLEEGRRILLFSSFSSMLELIEAHLRREEIPYFILTGKTTNRATLVRRFQAGEVPVFLISLKAGGTGLNLTAADTVIHYDPWWNPAAETQATDRAHRIGQDKPVFVHKLVCAGTIEDRILELQQHKAALAGALLAGETGKLRIDSETLSQLLAPLPD